MRIHITGNSSVAGLVSEWVGRLDPFVLSREFPAVTLQIKDYGEERLSVDTPDGLLEDQIIDRLREQAAFAPGIGRIMLDAEGGNQDPKLLVMRIPLTFSLQQKEHVARAVLHALLTVTGVNQTVAPWSDKKKAQPVRKAAKKAAKTVRKHRSSLVVAAVTAALVLVATMAFGQTVRQGAAGTQPWLFTCTSGCVGGGGGTVDQGTPAAAANAWPISVVFGGAVIDPRLVTSVQLPAALVGGRLDTNVGSWLGSTAPTVGQKTMAASVPVTFASDQPGITAIIQSTSLGQSLLGDGVTMDLELNPTMLGMGIEVLNTGLTGTLTIEVSVATGVWEAIPFVDATVIRTSRAFVADSGSYSFQAILTNGARYVRMRMASHSVGSTDLNFTQSPAAPSVSTWLGSVAPTVGQKTMTNSIPVVLPSNQSAIPVTSTQLPAALVGGRLDGNVGAWMGSTAATVGQKTMAASVPVVLPSDQSAVPTRANNDLTPASPAAATVGVASAQAVAANATRRGVVLVNTSVNTISCAFGASAVLASGLTLESGAAFTMNEYTFDLGAINCIASAASSNLSVQEFSN